MKLLETSYLVEYEKGRESARAYFDDHADEPLSASTVSMFELAFGVARDSSRELPELRESLNWVEVLDFSVEDALEAARVQAELQPSGERFRSPT